MKRGLVFQQRVTLRESLLIEMGGEFWKYWNFKIT